MPVVAFAASDFAVCGHIGPAESAFFTPDQCALVTGGMNRNLPTGGLAYGTPANIQMREAPQ